MTEFSLGRVGGLALAVQPLAFVGSAVLLVGVTLVGHFILQMSLLEAIILGVSCVALHWLGEYLHQVGHARAAQHTGHPMAGIRFGFLGLLSTSLYPNNEPSLPAAQHIHRALGGPKLSFVVAIVSFVVVLLVWNLHPVLRAVAVFFFLDNLFIFSLGSLLPLGFNDGSTILYWRSKS